MKQNILLLLFIITTANLFAQYGILDNNFNARGILTINTDSISEVNSITVQSDGKIILAGYDFNGYDFDFAVYRLLPDGSFDNSFGSNGKVLSDFSGDDKAIKVKIQSDKKILVAGMAANGNSFAMARYKPNGQPDFFFGLNGKVFTGIGTIYGRSMAMLLQGDGKIILVGNDYTPDFTNNYCTMVRYTANGEVDHSFSIGEDTLFAYIENAILLPDGKLMVAGYIEGAFSNYEGLVARFNPDGAIDSTYSYDGRVSVDFYYGDDFLDLAIQDNDKIVAVGNSLQGQVAFRSIFAMLNTDGLLDESFGLNGKFVKDTSAFISEGMYTALVQPDRKVITAGYGGDEIVSNFKIYRFDENGLPDNSFGLNGIILANDPFNYTNCGSYCVALQPDGNLLVGGFTTINDNKKMMIMRFTTGLPPLAIPQNMTNPHLSVFPNPFHDNITISLPTSEQHTLVTLMNTEGETIFTTELLGEKQSLNFGSLNPGLYMLKIQTSKGCDSQLIVKYAD